MPLKVIVTLPCFSPNQINIDELYGQFGSLSAYPIVTEKQNATRSDEEFSLSIEKIFLDEPKSIKDINIMYYNAYNVSCKNDEEIWTYGDDNSIKLYDLQGKMVRSTVNRFGFIPWDIVGNYGGDLVYTVHTNKSVNIVYEKNRYIVIREHGWIPLNTCSTLSGDLLVVMIKDEDKDEDKDENKETKIVRYVYSKEEQIIQIDDLGQPLYSSGCTKYISENKNRNVCVADYEASAVVVVNHAGKLKFRYTTSLSTKEELFKPSGINADSQCRILTVDSDNNCIHILDKDGQFLRYIDNCNLAFPWGICLDSKDNLFVVEIDRRKVKKIQYY